MSELTRDDLKKGHVYRAKRYQGGKDGGRPNNDRVILYLSSTHAQYDADTVRDGRHYPKVEIDKFLRWAKADVTDLVAKEAGGDE